MDIQHIDTNNLEREITIIIQPEDYSDKVKAELKRISKEVSFKGFRKGKVPMSYLKKTHAPAVLSSIVLELLEENLNDYIQAHEMRLLGQPLGVTHQEPIDFDVNKEKDYVFKFDIGIAPDIELKGLDKSNEYERWDVEIDDDTIDEEWESMRNLEGEQVEVEEDINENDIVVLEGKELEDGKVKEDGWETSFSIYVGKFNDALKSQIIGKDKGYTFEHDIYELTEDTDESFVREHYLNIDEDENQEINREFNFQVTEIKRLSPAEINDDFFERAFAGRAGNEEEARNLIRAEIKDQFDRQANIILSHEMRTRLLEENPIDLPYDFLKRWINRQQEENGKEMTDEEFQEFLEDTRWSLITMQMRDDYALEVSNDDIVEGITKEVSAQFQGYKLPEEFMQQFISNMAQDKEKVQEIAEKVMSDKIIATFKENVTIIEKPISIDEFNRLSKEFVEELNAVGNLGEEE